MAFARIGTFENHNRLVTDSLGQHAKLGILQQQVASGQVSQNFKGIAENVLPMNSAKALISTNEQLLRNIQFADLITDRNEIALDQLTSQFQLLQKAVVDVMGSSDAGDFVKTVESIFDSVSAIINTKQNGKSLFNGTKPEDEVLPSTFDREAVFSATQTPLAVATGAITLGPLQVRTATLTLATALPATESFEGSQFQVSGGGIPISGFVVKSISDDRRTLTVEISEADRAAYTQGSFTPTTANMLRTGEQLVRANMDKDTAQQQVIIDEGEVIQFSLHGRDMAAGLLGVIGDILQFHNGVHPVSGGTAFASGQNTVTDAQKQFLTDRIGRITEAVDDLAELQTENGIWQKNFEDATNRHEEANLFLANIVSEIEDVDQTQAISDLRLSETALQASFQALARIKQMSLVNFL